MFLAFLELILLGFSMILLLLVVIVRGMDGCGFVAKSPISHGLHDHGGGSIMTCIIVVVQNIDGLIEQQWGGPGHGCDWCVGIGSGNVVFSLGCQLFWGWQR